MFSPAKNSLFGTDPGKREFLLFACIIISLFVGIWHGFPATGLVADEQFPGAVLRAMENGTVFPEGTDVPYGTVTYYLTYVLATFSFAVMLPFFGFDILALKMFVVDHIYIAYLIGRLVSVMAGIILLFLTYGLARKSGANRNWSMIAVAMLFTTMIVVGILHTGKVWPVSLLFVYLSFFFVYRSVGDDEDVYNGPLGVLFAFLALSNFPLMGFSLIALPIVLYAKRGNKRALLRIILAIIAGIFVCTIVFVSNRSGIESQVASIVFDYTLSSAAQISNASYAQSVGLNIFKTMILYPLPLLVLLIALMTRVPVRDRKLWRLSLIYLSAYFAAICVVARWSVDPHSFLRYLFPVGFFLYGLLVSLEIKVRPYHIAILAVSAVFFIFELYYLALPTTLNHAAKWVENNLNRETAVIERYGISDLELPLNRESANMLRPEFCGAKCRFVIERGSNDFRGIVVTEQADSAKVGEAIARAKERYLVSDRELNGFAYRKAVSFENGGRSADPKYPLILEHIGDYFDPDFWRIGRLGRNIYIYDLLPM